MNSISARCLLCGKTYDVLEDHKDYPKLVAENKSSTFICDRCSHKVRYEADEQNKPKKPM